jgi:hypothetical protein
MESRDFWLYQWLDSYLVRSPQQGIELLNERGPFQELKKVAHEAAEARIIVDADENAIGQAIVAGSALDLSGQLTCMHDQCIRRQVDELFGSVWHYFDRIVVVGPSARYIDSQLTGRGNKQGIKRLLETYIRLLFYLRNIGAEEFLFFTERPSRWCEDCGRLLFLEIGVESPEAYQLYVEQLAERLVREGTFRVRTIRGRRAFEFSHPTYIPTPIVNFTGRRSAAEVTRDRRKIVASLTQRYVHHLIADINLSHRWHSPLGSTLKFHEQLLRGDRAKSSEADVALHLQLPILKGVSTETLLKIRKEEGQHFEAFRTSLRRAIRERIEVAPDQNTDAISREIVLDVIQPGLNDIRRRLNASRNLLLKKSAASIGLGVIATSCGFLGIDPLTLTTGVGAAMTALPAGHKYFEERREISLSDMYFLWQAQLHMREDA